MFENIPDLKDYIDLDSGLARVRGNKALFAKMLGMYLSSTELDNLDKLISEGNLEEAAKSAHTLKGMTGNLSLEAVFKYSTSLMNQLRDGSYNEADYIALKAANAKTIEYIGIVVEEFKK